MPRNISFSLTTAQVRAKTKTVTRRLGWRALKVGDVLNACVKCMGLKKGERPEVICQIRVTNVWRESLRNLFMPTSYGKEECAREGFPQMTPGQFYEFFCRSHKGCNTATVVTRIEFEYLPSSLPADVPALAADHTQNPPACDGGNHSR